MAADPRSREIRAVIQAESLDAVQVQPELTTKSLPSRSTLESAANIAGLIVEMLYLCALRPGELFALRWNDWDLARPGELNIDENFGKEGSLTPKTERSADYCPPGTTPVPVGRVEALGGRLITGCLHVPLKAEDTDTL